MEIKRVLFTITKVDKDNNFKITYQPNHTGKMMYHLYDNNNDDNIVREHIKNMNIGETYSYEKEVIITNPNEKITDAIKKLIKLD